MSANDSASRLVILGTELLPGDPAQVRRQKIARITLDSMVQFVGLLDASGNVLEINKVALDAVGITLAEVQGKPFWTTFWWQVSEDVNRRLRDAIARAATGEFVRWDTEIFGRAGGKEAIVIDASLTPVLDDTGKVVFICAEGRDITEKKAQERLIERQNAELQGLLQRIRELDEIKTQFFANVSHELRTPLTLILGPAQRLIEGEGTLTVIQQREAGEVIARNARMLLKHVNDLLDMSKIEARKLTIQLAETDVAELLRLLASNFSVLAAERGIELEVDAGQACLAAVDADKLQRVLMNLLGNAFKFVPNGGRVRCCARASARELTLVVEDSGPGVKPELRPLIFERFRQGDGGINRRVGGTGLGLAIAKEFVELHRGRIELLDSELGGARFQVVLPRHGAEGVPRVQPERPARGMALNETLLEGVLEELRAHEPSALSADAAAGDAAAAGGGPARATSESEGEPSAPGRPRVLVVEDNADMNRFVTQTLSPHYDVISAFDGRDGLDKARRYRPALILSDIMMPHVSGVEMITELRKVPELEKVPVLLLSAKADEELMTRLLEEGARDFIVKPFSEKDVLVRVRNLILAEQARQHVELQRRLLHSVFMQAPLLIMVLRGPRYVIELANPAMCEQILQRPPNELLNRPLFEALPELRDQGVPQVLDTVYRTGEPFVGRESAVQLERGGGRSETLYFDFIYSAFRDLEGNVDGIFVVASDVTAQVHARNQVDGLRVAAESANRAKDEFLAMLGHELRNPLSPILTALQLMKLRGDAGSERERLVIERQVNHLTRLVGDLLDVSRIARGRVELKTELLELSELVARAIEMSSPLLEQRLHHLQVDVPRHGLRVEGDPTRLSQVLSNLLTNAAKYTPPGGQISVRAQRADTMVVLSVRDNGVGIPRELLPRVFEAFQQAQQSQERAQGGLGLGLAIVRSLVERHGGTVTAHSEGPGTGSEFIVRLPLAERGLSVAPPNPAPTPAPAPPVQHAAPQAPAAAHAERILIVDDNEDSAELLAEALAQQGYDTRVAHDAPDALRTARTFAPEIAILDIGLPVMDGYELAAHLRELPGLGEIRLIALTGYGREEDRQRTRAAGFQHHLVKPVEMAAVREALGSKPRA